MMGFTGALKVYLAIEPQDMRKLFNGLYAAAENELGEEATVLSLVRGHATVPQAVVALPARLELDAVARYPELLLLGKGLPADRQAILTNPAPPPVPFLVPNGDFRQSLNRKSLIESARKSPCRRKQTL